MSDALTFTLPLPSKNLGSNSRAHWAVKHTEKRTIWAMADTLVKGKVNPKPPKDAPWPKARLTARMVVFNPLDPDGALARLKCLIDWMVKRGYLVDDRAKNLVMTIPEQRVSRKNSPSVEITLERLDP